MKKNSKPVIVFIIVFLLLITAIVLIAQGLRFKYEELIRERARIEEEIRSEKTKKVNHFADYQMYTDEDLIKEFAVNELGMVEENKQSIIKITINKEELEDISEQIQEKNE
jgi:hypothetical protein